MSKAIIDYSNTVFYKIYCKDTNIDDVYIGHTINFVQRKQAHKTACNKSSDPSHNFKVYKFIREQGGWDNWNMDMIGFKNCKDRTQACIIEQEYFESHKASLNSVLPYKTPTEILPVIVKEKLNLYCEVCKIDCNCRNSFEKHKSTKKHQRLENVQNNTDIPTSRESSFKFHCELCDYKTANKKDFSKHTMTVKHQRMTIHDNDMTETSPLCKYKCCCGNEYKYRQGLHKHKKTCNYSIQSNENTINAHSVTVDTNILTQILQENKEIREAVQQQQEQNNKQIQDLIPKLQQVININNTPDNIECC